MFYLYGVEATYKGNTPVSKFTVEKGETVRGRYELLCSSPSSPPCPSDHIISWLLPHNSLSVVRQKAAVSPGFLVGCLGDRLVTSALPLSLRLYWGAHPCKLVCHEVAPCGCRIHRTRPNVGFLAVGLTDLTPYRGHFSMERTLETQIR